MSDTAQRTNFPTFARKSIVNRDFRSSFYRSAKKEVINTMWLLFFLFGCMSIAANPCGDAFVIRSGPMPHRRISSSSLLLKMEVSPPNNKNDANSNQKPDTNNNDNNHNMFQSFSRWLAELSLQDYQWRTDVFKSISADRMIDNSLARLRGESTAPYVRPMDAAEIGPLGTLERNAVQFLNTIFEEEKRRAQKIVQRSGKLVRPSDNTNDDDGAEDSVQQHPLGPLGKFEASVVQFWKSIREAEQARVRTQTLRPKDVEETKRGPLGNLEWRFAQWIEQIKASERLRMQLSDQRKTIVRPIDVPQSPLGELELQIGSILRAEEFRLRQQQKYGTTKIIRPKDAEYPGLLGNAESNVYQLVRDIIQEETQRWISVQKYLQENRPMERSQSSVLGTMEAFIVGIVRSPQLIVSVIQRVSELLQSDFLLSQEETMDPTISSRLKKQKKQPRNSDDETPSKKRSQ